MEDLQAKRLAHNETIFRRVNELVRDAEARVQHDFPRFVCECSNIDCDRRILVPLDVYISVRDDRSRFVIHPGHAMTDIERVVDTFDDFEIVEKIGIGREIAEGDPST